MEGSSTTHCTYWKNWFAKGYHAPNTRIMLLLAREVPTLASIDAFIQSIKRWEDLVYITWRLIRSHVPMVLGVGIDGKPRYNSDALRIYASIHGYFVTRRTIENALRMELMRIFV